MAKAGGQQLRDAAISSVTYVMGDLSTPVGQRAPLNGIVTRGRPLLSVAILLLAGIVKYDCFYSCFHS